MSRNELIEALLQQNTILLGMLKSDEELLSADEAAEMLRCTKSTIYKMAREGQIETVRVRYNVCIRKSAVKRFIETGGTQGF